MDDAEKQLLKEQIGILIRIAAALETIARGSEPEEPNLQKPIEEFAGFNWDSIGATVVKKDANGPTHLEYGGYLWIRRSPTNKYGPAIWFSRSAGKDAEGNTRYLRLISFRTVGEADPLPEKASALLEKSKPPAAKQETQKTAEQAADQALEKVRASKAADKENPEEKSQKAQPEKPNGKRPYTPEQLRTRLGEIQALHTGKEASEPQRGLVAMLLEKCFAGENDASDKRRTVQKYLFGTPSLKDVFDSSVLAALDWLKPTRDSGGDYQSDALAIQEARAVYREALKAEGQTEMFD
jgi:hypothetical protein